MKHLLTREHRMDMDLNLPVIKGKMPEDRYLSMDDYLKFVIFGLKHIVDIKTARKQRRQELVGKPFRFK